MHIRILGSAAGGGFPQWNCNCRNCRGLREGTLSATARTQSSIALSDDGVNWIICNASPDIRAQIEAFPALQPARALRDTAIRALILLDSQIDHTTGLLTLREGCPHEVWCSEMVHQDLTSGFPLFNMLEHWNGGLRWNPIDLEQSFTVAACPALRFTPIPLRSAAPPYSPHRNDPHPGDNIGLPGRGPPQRRAAVLRPRPRPGRRRTAGVDGPRRLPAGRRHPVDRRRDDPRGRRRQDSAAPWATCRRAAPAACSKCSSACRASARCSSTSTTPTRSSTRTRPQRAELTARGIEVA